jgi:hypothetical protein
MRITEKLTAAICGMEKISEKTGANFSVPRRRGDYDPQEIFRSATDTPQPQEPCDKRDRHSRSGARQSTGRHHGHR